MLKKFTTVLLIIFFTSVNVKSQNPIIKNKFTADPCAMVYGNTVYLYTGHDEASTSATDYEMNNWHVFSSQDMVNWTDHGQRLGLSDFTWANAAAFAGHVIHRNGKFYWYVPMLQKGGGFFSIGVAVADNPLGPFKDALGKPLIADNLTPDLKFDIDPAVFIDDDGQAYIYWGNATDAGPCKVAKLKSNMTELDGPVTTVNIPKFTEAPYLHKNNGLYYLSYAAGWPETIDYATSKSPMGPWTPKGTLNTRVTSSTNHQSIIQFKGKSYFFYHNAFPDLGGGDYRRSVCVDELNYNSDGTIKPIVRTTEGPAPAALNTDATPWNLTEKLTGAHDPAMIRDDRGVYTLLTTNNLLEIRQSADMLNWTSKGKIFNAVPSWMKTVYPDIADIWAPHISFHNGRYWVYYCGSMFGTRNSLIGVASSPTLNTSSPDYKWTDHGEVYRTSQSGDNVNAIDPEFIRDNNGKYWLTFGSWSNGIRMIAIDPATGKQSASDKTIYSLASRRGGIEGPSMIEHNGFYCLFTSLGTCCAGTESTYQTAVGRSTSPAGGYADKSNVALMNGGGSIVLSQYGRYYGPGGGSPFRDGRRDYYVLHYYDGSRNGAPTLQTREIVWTNDNWPVLAQPFLGRRLSYEAEHSILTNAVINTGTGTSNKEYVGNINFNDSRLQFYISALAAGEYTLRIHFTAADGPASHFIKVNGGAVREVFYPKTPAWGQFPSGQSVSVKVNLTEGGNLIEFTKGTGFAELDKIDLVRNTFDRLEGGAMDNGVSVTYVKTDNNAKLIAGSWMMFENVDFANGGIKKLNLALQTAGTAQFRINLDNQTGSTNVTFTTVASGKINSFNLPASFSSVTGVHDVYISVLSGAAELDYLQFGLEEELPGVADCNGTINGTAKIDACSQCAGGTTGISSCTGSIQAEDACQVDGDAAENINGGFTGTGYANSDNTINAVISWNINSASNKISKLSIRYANGGSSARDGVLFVNGVQASVVSLPVTGSWSAWMTSVINADLKSGLNEISLKASSADGLANIDLISWSDANITAAGCIVTGTLPEENNELVYAYPNPFSDKLTMTAENPFYYELYSVNGNLLKSGTCSGSCSLFETVNAGFYLLKIFNKERVSIIPVTKE